MMRIYLLFVLSLVVFSWSIPKPMESIENYNVMLIHGAADSLSGMYCEAPDLKEAFAYYKAAEEDSNALGMEAL